MDVRSKGGRFINLKGDIAHGRWGCIANAINGLSQVTSHILLAN